MDEPKPGDAVGRYTVIKVLHRGSRDTIVLEGQSETVDLVAIKQCPEDAAEREKTALLRLKENNPNCLHVVRLVDFHRTVDVGFQSLILELGEIGLDAWLRERAFAPTWAETLDVGHAVGSALAFMHQRGMVCGDVKPANVMQFRGNRWKLIDLGGASEVGAPRVEFTSSYCAPEVAKAFLQGQQTTSTTCSDVWAYGKMMFEMACGSPSAIIDELGHDEDNVRHVLEQVAALQDNVIDNSKGRLRFPALNVMLQGMLRCTPPRTPLEIVMSRGLWTGNVTSSTHTYSSGSQTPTGEGPPPREQAVMELLETESQYCDRLRALISDFIVPLKTHGMPELTDMRVFDDVVMLSRSNEFFLRQLRVRVEKEGNRCLGDIMAWFARTLLRNYEEYVTRYRGAHDRLQACKRDSGDFRTFAQNGIGPNHDAIEDYLILPVQRLMRYKLLLEQIVKHTSDKESEEYADLNAALAAVTETIDAINTRTCCTAEEWNGYAYAAKDRKLYYASIASAVIACAAIGLGVWAWRKGAKKAHTIMEQMKAAEDEKHKALQLLLQNQAIIAQQQAQLQMTHSQLAKSNAELERSSNTIKYGAITSSATALVLAALFAFSDQRLKCKTRYVRTSPSGLRVYQYAYVWEPGVLWQGVLAQELLDIKDDRARAVKRLPSGFLIVDYSLLDVKPKKCKQIQLRRTR